jgi:hypothetical protein
MRPREKIKLSKLDTKEAGKVTRSDSSDKNCLPCHFALLNAVGTPEIPTAERNNSAFPRSELLIWPVQHVLLYKLMFSGN